MNLDQLQIDARPRPYWQAIDLGMALLRRHARTVYLSWWAIWATLAGLLALLTPQDWLMWNWLVLWWLRPLIERSTIFILSRAVFNEEVGVRDTLRAWPAQLRLGWLRTLTWWRPIVIGRGLWQPVWQLEGARGQFASQRRRVLGARGAYGSAAWYGVICAHFEFVLQFALISLLGIFLSDPDSITPFLLLQDEFAPGSWENHLPLFTYLLSGGIMGPIYTAGCFTLYLNRRAELEGWDIEITLRKLAHRRSSQLLASGKAAATLLLACLCWLALPAPEAQAAPDCSQLPKTNKYGMPVRATASRPASQGSAQTAIRADIDRLAAGPEFSVWECRETWQAKKTVEDKEREADPPPKWLQDLFGDFDGPNLPVAEILKVTFITLLVLLVAWLLFRNRALLGRLLETRDKDPQPTPAHEICGLDIRPESLPDDVPSSVLRLWRDGQRRAALALLYRASLSRLAHAQQLELAAGFTEGDCLAVARQAQQRGTLRAATLEFFTELTRHWQAAAYADRWLDDERFSSLCRSWRASIGDER
ncbi:DUF4129 domain-containing protein [Chitinilyticum litopenaei]|uniref:DUF4129 domain-containing protein n=1 Tax=Chitinilyticum litopenaei TaxID=1121276 RepID=UPI00040EF2C3|nr:DUF4129 domain-containing protein [Chitinilyticum litopenaei]